MRNTLSGLLALAACVTAGDALARFNPIICRLPSAQQCANPDYQRSRCGRQKRSFCTGLMVTSARLATNDAPLTEAVNPDGEIITAREMPAAQETMRVSGFNGRYAGDPLKQQMLSIDGDGINWPLIGHQVRRARWNNNGTRVTSCAEYVYERWYDYSTYEDAAAELGDDWRAIHDAAWDSGVLNAILRSKDIQRSFSRPALSERRNRNAYAAAQPHRWQAYTDLLRDSLDEHPALHNRLGEIELHDYDPALIARVRRASHGFTETWAWHQRANQALANESDEMLMYLEDKASEFAKVVAARNAAVRAVLGAGQVYTMARARCRGIYFQDRLIGGGDCSRVEPAIDAWVNALNALGRADAAVEAGLREGQSLGCLDNERIGRCDWSPRALVKRLEGHYLTEREEDFDRCTAVTSENFARLRNADWLRTAYCDVLPCNGMTWITDFTIGTHWVDEYMRRAQRWVDALDLPIDPATGTPMIAQSVQDSGSSGDSLFGVDFNYTLGWNVSDLVEGGEANTCEADIAVTGTVTVGATAFKSSVPDIFEATFALIADGAPGPDGRQDVDVTAEIIVLGRVFDSIEIDDTAFHFADDLGQSHRLTPDLFLPVPVAGIPLVLRGWMSGKLGVRYSIDAGVERNCNLNSPTVDIGVRAGFSPYATVDGHATASLDFYIVDVGVGVDLNLINLALPFTAALAMRLGNGVAELTANAGLDLDIASLAGRIKVFVEPLIGSGWQKTLFAWKGVHDRIALFGESFTYPIDTLADLLAAQN